MKGGNIVVYYRDELKDVDGDESSVFVVRFEEKCPMLDLLGEVNVQSEA